MENSILRQIAFHYSLFPLNEVDARVLFGTVNPDDTTYGESLNSFSAGKCRIALSMSNRFDRMP